MTPGMIADQVSSLNSLRHYMRPTGSIRPADKKYGPNPFFVQRIMNSTRSHL
jgi:hypothetical protein